VTGRAEMGDSGGAFFEQASGAFIGIDKAFATPTMEVPAGFARPLEYLATFTPVETLWAAYQALFPIESQVALRTDFTQPEPPTGRCKFKKKDFFDLQY
jgi:hypothetical protein